MVDAARSPIAATAVVGRLTTWRPVHLTIIGLAFVAWTVRAVMSYQDPSIGGLFRWIGIDFGFYLAQARAFAEGNVGAMYSVDVLGRYASSLAEFTNDPATPLAVGQVPYPPVFAWVLSPLAAIPPPLALAIWSAICMAAALAVAWRVVTLFPADRRLLAVGVLLLSTPFVFSVWFGNAQVLLSLAFGEAFLALRKGRDPRAGIWLSVLLLKPQYLLIVLPILLWKGRWGALGGFALGGLFLTGASLAVAGPATMTAYLGSLTESATAAGGVVLHAVAPDVMINWRALVVRLPIDGSEATLVAITLALSLVTIILVLHAWRGPWRPTEPRFAVQMTLVAIGTVLASYHSHSFGALMLAVPLAAHLASATPRDRSERVVDRGIGLALAVGVVGPWLWFAVLGRGYPVSNVILAFALVAGLVLFLVRCHLMDRPIATESPDDARLRPAGGAETAVLPVDVRREAETG